jgi:hypothetical protein
MVSCPSAGYSGTVGRVIQAMVSCPSAGHSGTVGEVRWSIITIHVVYPGKNGKLSLILPFDVVKGPPSLKHGGGWEPRTAYSESHTVFTVINM